MSSLLTRGIYMFVAVAIVTAIGFSIPALVQSSSAGNEKVEICHIPPGNLSNAHTIEVSENAIDAHFAHGDFEGKCVCPCFGINDIDSTEVPEGSQVECTDESGRTQILAIKVLDSFTFFSGPTGLGLQCAWINDFVMPRISIISNISPEQDAVCADLITSSDLWAEFCED